jgi:hypothetical protein
MADSLQPFLEQIKEETTWLKWQQVITNEKLQELVEQAKTIGRAVSCGESRQDAWTGESTKYLSNKQEETSK